jgi:hypothetical protein
MISTASSTHLEISSPDRRRWRACGPPFFVAEARPLNCVSLHSSKEPVRAKTYRIGQIVPSSNTTMETEIPAMLTARQMIRPERFTFHSSRMRMKKVVKEELAAMDAESDRCAIELSDARVDVLGYACLVAIMAMGLGYHSAVGEAPDRPHSGKRRRTFRSSPAPAH